MALVGARVSPSKYLLRVCPVWYKFFFVLVYNGSKRYSVKNVLHSFAVSILIITCIFTWIVGIKF